MTAPSRPLRRDAAANRERVLHAAAEVFDEKGSGAGLDDVARRAGVGVATVYRRFPSREALLEELLADLFARLAGETERCLALADGEGLAAFVRAAGELQASPRGCALRLWHSLALEDRRVVVRDGIAALVTQAREQGTCRPDVVPEDVIGVLVALRGMREVTTAAGQLDWRRHLELCLLGLRPRP